MARTSELSANLYPGTDFATDFDFYHRVATDMVRAVATVYMAVSESGFERDPETTECVLAALETPVERSYTQAGYKIAYEKYMQDAVANNRKGLYQILYTYVEHVDPVDVLAHDIPPHSLNAAERQEHNFELIDALRRRPRTSEGQTYASIAMQRGFTDEQIAEAIDVIRQRRSMVQGTTKS